MFPAHKLAKPNSKRTRVCILVYYTSFIILSLYLSAKKIFPGVRRQTLTQPTMSSLSEHLKSHAEELAAFWDRFGVAEHQDAINKYLGTRSVDDLRYVGPADVQSLSFNAWAATYLTVVAKNRLVAAVKSLHTVPSSPAETQI